mgnify:CR=1 FL=1
MDKPQIISITISFVKETLKGAEGGHDWFHIERVYKNALLIAKSEDVDEFIVSLGALLHDIADAKFYDGDETIGPKIAREFLENQQVDESVIVDIEKIINFISFKSKNGIIFLSLLFHQANAAHLFHYTHDESDFAKDKLLF